MNHNEITAAILADFARRQTEARADASRYPNSMREARHEAEARTWRLAAEIVERASALAGEPK